MLDFSKLLPESLKPVAKAAVVVAIGAVGILVQLTVVDVNDAAVIVSTIVTVGTALGVYQATNSV